MTTTAYPAVKVRMPAITQNCQALGLVAHALGVSVCPHAKTTMSPACWVVQANGAWGFTVATVSQAMSVRRAGYKRIMIANQVVDAVALRALAEDLAGEGEVLVFVDSPVGIDLLAHAIDDNPQARLGVLIEVGLPHLRAGVRAVAGAKECANRLRDLGLDRLQLRGVASYEGTLAGESEGEVETMARKLFGLTADCLAAVADDLAADAKPIYSVGGSLHFDLVTHVRKRVCEEMGAEIIVRPGGYVAHDTGYYAERLPHTNRRLQAAGFPTLDLVNAAELWAPILSLPEAGTMILGFGRRHYTDALGLPAPIAYQHPHKPGFKLKRGSIEVVALNEQHAIARHTLPFVPRIGDLVACAPSNPGGLFQHWQAVQLVDAEDTILGTAETLFGDRRYG